MLKRTFYLLLVMGLIAATLLAAKDPFVGTWKLNQSKSKITGEQLSIRDLGGNKYTITFGNISYTLLADGTDQTIPFGRTRSITKESPNVWKVVTKKQGRLRYTSTWTLSRDGKTMDFEIAEKQPDGPTSHSHVVAKRIAGSNGFAGTWESTNVRGAADYFKEWVIRPYEKHGLSFIAQGEHEHQNIKFDGKAYPDEGPNALAGLVTSAKRVNERTLEMTDRAKGKVLDTYQCKLSSDLKTMTVTIHETGQPSPLTVVYERE